VSVILRALILGGLLVGFWLGLRRAGIGGRERVVWWLATAFLLLGWYTAVWQFARGGGFESRWNLAGRMVPPIPFAIFLPLLIWLPPLLRSKQVARVLDAVSPAWLVGFQVYRLRGGVFLARWAEGALPGAFALPAGIGDVLVGALALPVALVLRSGARGGRAAAWAWNVLGIVDLLVAITLGALTTTGRLPVDIPNTVPRSYPLVMIPAFAVPLSLILHSVSLRQLKRSRSIGLHASGGAQPQDGGAPGDISDRPPAGRCPRTVP
jgi:hypothetical protein